jgi:hypothetical protein
MSIDWSKVPGPRSAPHSRRSIIAPVVIFAAASIAAVTATAWLAGAL